MRTTRRAALLWTGAALAATLPVAARIRKRKSVAEVHAEPVIINALGGIEDPNAELLRQSDPLASPDRPELTARALRDLRVSGLTAVNVTLGYVAGPAEPFEFSVRSIGMWDEFLRENSARMSKIYTTHDLLTAQREHKLGIIFGFQNAAMLGTDATRADLFAALGVRVIQLTYNPANALGDGCMASENRGLTQFGREVVGRLNERRVMVDLSHSGENTCLDAIRASTAPLSINHTGCRALADLPPNKTDAELRKVADKGGFVGIYFMPFLRTDGGVRAEDIVAHIEHAVQVCGEEHVGIGTDGSVTQIDDLQNYRARLAKEVAERADRLPFAIDLRGPEQFHQLASRLEKRGHSTGRIEKILGGNFLRFAHEVWGA